MYATDFIFDGHRARDFGCMICSFDENAGTVSGGEMEYSTVKPPGSDRTVFYGAQFNSAATWNFSICKDPDLGGSPYFDQYEEGRILKWLVKTDGYHFLQFEQEGYEDIYYRVYFNVLPHQAFGQTVGFDLTVTSDCAYGFSGIITRKAEFSSHAWLMLDVHSDVNAYILPTVRIKSAGSLTINNYSEPANAASPPTEESLIGKPSVFRKIGGDDGMYGEILMDSASDIVTGLGSPGDFNWNFLKLADGKNFLEFSSGTGSPVYVEIQYREPRYVRI